MALGRWRKLSEEVLFQNRWWTYRLDRFELPSGRQGEYHYVHTAGSAMVVPVTASGRLLLVNQYRYLLERESLEFPGGGIREGTAPEAAARAELAEETGQAAAELVPAGRFNPYNGVADEMCHVFVARGLRPAAGAAPDETEELELRELAPGEVDAAIRSGTIWDGMTMAAWCLVRPLLGA